MAKPETLIDYGRRIARVSQHIADHLDAEIDVERLAAVAYFSPWHFHRIYRETTGETVADTVRRLRLHRAAVELTRGDTPLGRIAKRAGYGTLAAFSRAFSADYGVPPGAYRLRGKLLPPAPLFSSQFATFSGLFANLRRRTFTARSVLRTKHGRLEEIDDDAA